MNKKESRDVDVLQAVWSVRWRILVFSLVITVVTYAASHSMPDEFIAKSTVIITPPKFSVDKKSSILSVEDYQRLALSHGILQKVVDRLKSTYLNYQGVLYPEALKKMISLEFNHPARVASKIGRATHVVFNVRGSDRTFIKDIVNTLVALVIETSHEVRGNEIKTMAKDTKALHAANLDDLQKAERALQEAMTSNHLDSAELSLQLKRTNLKQHEIMLMRINIELVNPLASSLPELGKPPNLSNKHSSKKQSTYNSIYAKQQFLIKIIKKIKNEIRTLENNIFRMRLQEKQLKRNIAHLTNSNGILTHRLEQIVLSKSENIGDMKLLFKGREPYLPVGPPRLQYALIAAASSFFLGLIVACAKEHIDNNLN